MLGALLVSASLLDGEHLLLAAKSFKVVFGYLPLSLGETLVLEPLEGALACLRPISVIAQEFGEAEATWSEEDLVLAAEIGELLLVPVCKRDCVINMTSAVAPEGLGTVCGTSLSDVSTTLA